MSDPTSQDVLRAERELASARLEALVAEFDDIVARPGDGIADDEHDPEGPTIAFERAWTAALVSQARRTVRELDLALARAEDGTYGLCQACGSLIHPARLAALPTARTCVQCAAVESRTASTRGPSASGSLQRRAALPAVEAMRSGSRTATEREADEPQHEQCESDDPQK